MSTAEAVDRSRRVRDLPRIPFAVLEAEGLGGRLPAPLRGLRR